MTDERWRFKSLDDNMDEQKQTRPSGAKGEIDTLSENNSMAWHAFQFRHG
jgi:hypothetical protein